MLSMNAKCVLYSIHPNPIKKWKEWFNLALQSWSFFSNKIKNHCLAKRVTTASHSPCIPAAKGCNNWGKTSLKRAQSFLWKNATHGPTGKAATAHCYADNAKDSHLPARPRRLGSPADSRAAQPWGPQDKVLAQALRPKGKLHHFELFTFPE